MWYNLFAVEKTARIMVGIAQLARAPDCGSGGHRFDSDYPPHLYIGMSPSGKATDFDSVIRWFESSHPSQEKRQVSIETCRFSMISVPCGTGDIADAMISATQMIYASRMKERILYHIAQAIYHYFCESSKSYTKLQKIFFYPSRGIGISAKRN